MNIAIIGAGNIGTALAKLFTNAGHDVMLSSRHPNAVRAEAAQIGCRVDTVLAAADFGEVVVVAVPFDAYTSIPVAPLADKIVIDTTNYYPDDRDARVAALDEQRTTTSEMVSAHLQGARIVKAFNAILAIDLPADDRPHVEDGRHALPIAGDHRDDKATVAALHEEIGFDVVDAGMLSEGWRFERARPCYCIPLDAEKLRETLERTERDDFVEHFSWRRNKGD